MTYITFEPLRQDNIQRTLNKFFEAPSAQTETNYSLRADVTEDEINYYVEAELAGIKKEDLKISLHEDRLTISGEKKAVKESKKYLKNERYFGSFSRSFVFPERVNTENTEAKYENGVLTVIVPKYKKASTERVINIQ